MKDGLVYISSYTESMFTVWNLLQFEREMITKLDELVGADHGDKDFQEKFYEM